MDELKRIFGTIFLILFLASPAWAVGSRVRYVNTASSGGDGTTNNTSGGTAAYATMFAMEAAENGDLVAADVVLTVNCTGTDGTIVDFSGWTTDATRTIIIDGGNTYTHLTTNYSPNITVNAKNITFKRMIAGRNTASTNIDVFKINNGNVTLDQITAYLGTTATLDSGNAMVEAGGAIATETITIQNSVFYNALRKGIYVTIDAGANYNFYNNTIDGAETDNFFLEANTSAGAVINFRNNLMTNKGSGSDYSMSPGTATLNTQTNGTSDATSPEAGLRSLTIAYTNASAGDFTLVSGGAIDAGTDLSGTFTVDRAGTTRSAPWELGAYNYSSSTSKPFSVLNAMGEL